jgi:hypothetical protein
MKQLTITARINNLAIIFTVQNAFIFSKEKVKTYFSSLEKKNLKLHSDEGNPSTLNCLEYEGAMEYHYFYKEYFCS